MHNWAKRQLIGFSVKNLVELKRVRSLDGVNLVEVRLEALAKSGMPLYEYRDGHFVPRGSEIGMLREAARGLVVQFHLSIEKGIDGKSELGLSTGVSEHHPALLERFRILEYIHRGNGLGRVLTLHPPLIFSKGQTILDESEALENARVFFNRLDALRIRERHQTLIGVENQTDVKTLGGMVGYLPAHFKTMLRDTRTIGLTVDVGHRRLTKAFTIREFMALGMDFVNFHFHGNAGEFNPENWDDDQHLLPTRENINANSYKNYLRYFRRKRPPIILEISHLEGYTDRELSDFVRKLKKELQ